MFKLAVAGSVAALAAASNHPINQDVVDHIKKHADTWVPLEVHENPLANLSVAEVFGLLGSKVGGDAPNGNYKTPELRADIPANYDLRAESTCVHPIRDQGACGSCWAFAATEALSDRICLASGGRVDVVLSPEYMISCDEGNMGCNGGYLNKAWDFLEKTGAPVDSCFEYTQVEGDCPAGYCPDGGNFKAYKCKKNSIVNAKNAKQIQSAILDGGPLETGFQVYKDFMSYKSGIYKKTSPFWDYLGGHAVKIIGWGNENGTNYWLAANSWSERWGENGFFRIAFGQVGFDSDTYACEPELDTAFLA